MSDRSLARPEGRSWNGFWNTRATNADRVTVSSELVETLPITTEGALVCQTGSTPSERS
jgi:hypothetical protein